MKRLLILSGKGGTGKTTIASAFIKLHNAKAFADCDVDAPNLHLILDDIKFKKKDYYGMEKAVINQDICINCGKCKENCHFDAIINNNNNYKIDDFSCEGCGLCEAVCPVDAISMTPNVVGDLLLHNKEAIFSSAELYMGNGNSGKLVSEVKKELEIANDIADIAFIDGSPGIGCPVIASISGVDLVLIVTEPSISGISDMLRIIKTTTKFGVETLICINKYDINNSNTNKIKNICKDLNLPLIGMVPYDFNIVKALNNGQSIIKTNCPATTAITNIYNKALNYLTNI